MNEKFSKSTTICWMCANATGKCSWSEDFIPVKCWTAELRKIKIKDDELIDSYIVKKCPMFERDSINDGQTRINR